MTVTDDYESYPPWILAGPVHGQDFTGFADLATLKADPTFGDGSGWLRYGFGSGAYVTLGDASAATWDGTTWTAFVAPMSAPTPHTTPVTPSASWTKARIVDWLRAQGVAIADDVVARFTKDELLDIVDALVNGDIDTATATARLAPLPPIDDDEGVTP